MYEADQTTLEMANFPIEGNITDHAWPFIIIKENGKPDHLAIALLAHIVYWYRPVFDPITKKIGKKYKADLLQRSYAEIEDMIGLTKREAQGAFERLEKLGIVHRVLRTIEINGQKISNVLYIKFNPNKLTAMREAFFKKCIPLYAEKDEGIRQKAQGYTPKVTTYTETTSETSSKNTTTTKRPAADDVSSSSKKEKNNNPPPEIKFSDHEREQLNNYTPEQISQATEITHRDCIQRANHSRVKFFFKVLENLQEKPANKPKLTPYEILSKQFKSDRVYGKTCRLCAISPTGIGFTSQTGYDYIGFEFDEFFSWNKFDEYCKKHGITYKRD